MFFGLPLMRLSARCHPPGCFVAIIAGLSTVTMGLGMYLWTSMMSREEEKASYRESRRRLLLDDCQEIQKHYYEGLQYCFHSMSISYTYCIQNASHQAFIGLVVRSIR